MEKKIIVIGAGVAGLTAGICGRLAGFETEIYEKNDRPGGVCMDWERGGVRIAFPHWLAELNGSEETPLRALWRQLGVRPDSRDEAVFCRARVGEQSLELLRNADQTEASLLAESNPADAPLIRQWMALARQAAAVPDPVDAPGKRFAAGNRWLFRGKNAGDRHLEASLRTFRGETVASFAQRVQTPALRMLLTVGCPPLAPAEQSALRYGSFLRGAAQPEGGCGGMIAQMARRYTELGGKLYCGRPAVMLLSDRGHTLRCWLGGDDFADGDYFIPAADSFYAFRSLIGRKYMGNFLREWEEVPEERRFAGGVQVALRCPPGVDFPEGRSLISLPMREEPRWLAQSTVMMVDAVRQSDDSRLLLLNLPGNGLAYGYYASMDSEVYKRRKWELAEEMISILETVVPDCSGKLQRLDVLTPRTWERFCHVSGGWGEGGMLTTAQRRKASASFLPKKLDNVFPAGSWCAPLDGAAGAAVSGRDAVGILCRREKKALPPL